MMIPARAVRAARQIPPALPPLVLPVVTNHSATGLPAEIAPSAIGRRAAMAMSVRASTAMPETGLPAEIVPSVIDRRAVMAMSVRASTEMPETGRPVRIAPLVTVHPVVTSH